MKTEKEQLFSNMIKKWVANTWLGWWKIDVVFLDFKEYSEQEDIENPYRSVAICITNWEYMYAVIKVNSSILENEDIDDIEYYAIHELMHVILNEMREDSAKHEERVATFLAKSFLQTEKSTIEKLG